MRNEESAHTETVEFWRRRILSGIIWAYFWLGTIACVAGVVVAVGFGAWAVVAFDIAGWLLVLGLVLCPARFHRLRGLGLVTVTFGVGSYFTYRFGPFAAGPFWLFAGPMMAGALFGGRAAAGALGLLVLILACIGLLLNLGAIVWPGEVPVAMWVVLSASLAALAGVISVSVGMLLDGIARANREREDAMAARELLEQQLRHSQKMEAVGRLAGGIAHDFNNLLVAISGFTEFAMRSVKDNRAAIADLSEVTKTVDRGRALTEQLLAFTRKNVAVPQTIDVTRAIRDAERLLEQLAGPDIRVDLEIGPERCTTRIDPDAFIQVIVNATLNARDAMPNGGVLRVETTQVRVDGVSPGPSSIEMKPGDYVVTSVSDTGVGISEQDLEKIFEPFFTTKPQGEGTGLGLSTCWAVARQAGGYVDMRSQVGAGTTLSLYLPAAMARAEGTGTSEQIAPTRGHEAILIVEDDEQVRTMLTRALQDNGYDILQASHGDQALALARDQDVTIDLIVTDVILPGQNGREVASRVLELRPEISVLYVSGYSDEVLSRRGVLEEGVALLKKPFTLEAFATKVREMLDAPS